MDRAQAERILLSKGWLARQTPGFQDSILAHAELVQFEKGEYVYRIGDPPGGLYGIVAGSFGTYLATPWTGPDLSHILHSGCWCGEGPALGGQARVLTLRAMEPTAALYLPLEAARRLMQADAEVARGIGALGQVALRIAALVVSDLMIRRVDRRVGAVLLRVTGAREDAVLRPTEDVRLTQGQLGQMANVSRALVNRTLAQFEAEGWVRLGYNRIAIRDPEALAAFAYAKV